MTRFNSQYRIATAMTVRQQLGGLQNHVTLQGVEVTIESPTKSKSNGPRKLDFRDLGRGPAKAWKGIDPMAFVEEERSSW